MDKIFFTYKIPDEGMLLLKKFDVEVNTEDRFLPKEEIIQKAKDAAALVTL